MAKSKDMILTLDEGEEFVSFAKGIMDGLDSITSGSDLDKFIYMRLRAGLQKGRFYKDFRNSADEVLRNLSAHLADRIEENFNDRWIHEVHEEIVAAYRDLDEMDIGDSEGIETALGRI